MTANADRGLRPERVAEIIVAPGGGDAGRRGSGYLVSPGKVLTAAHVVEGAAGVRVRFQADRPGERIVKAGVVWRHEGIDVAVLALPDGEETAVDRVAYGRVGEQDAVLRCTALGFPRFKLRTDEDGSRFRDAEHAHATCAVLSNRREGTLDLGVTSPPPDDPDPERDAWEGMSGAAVFSNARLVGVVTRHHRTDGPGRIAASRVDRWAEILNGTELSELSQLLGCGLHPSSLPDVVPVTGLDLIQKVYRAQLADIAPEELKDRDAELADLVAFCSGPDSYLWLQGPPWAGKTALAAWFALHPPRGVVPVWFFITARHAGQSDSNAYTGAVIDQLAAIAGREPTGSGSPTARDGERRLLLRQAAERVAQDGGTLVLVVDGLDEDQSRVAAGGNGASIASLLPAKLPPNVRVLVTSRPSPGLPPDVGGGHLLRHCRVVKLSTTAAARHTEYEARFDLEQALSGDQLQRDLVGLLTAARGTLTVEDLRELTGEPAYELRKRLGSAFGRILRLRGGDSGGDATLYGTGRGYLFAHETLLAAAQDELGPDADVYLERLHSWAETYQRRGWPENTPVYLLQQYGRLLALLPDTRRTVALATDAGRRDRLREATGSNAAWLAEVATARQTVRRGAPADLGDLAALSAVADLMTRRDEPHPDIPATYARLGHIGHAVGLARSVFHPMHRARALADVALVLAEAGNQRAVGLAEEAAVLIEATLAEDRRGHGDPHALETQGKLATALAVVGREDEALRRIDGIPLPNTDVALKALVGALVATATALRDAAWAAGALRRAQEAAEKIEFVTDRIRVLAAVAEAWEAVDPGCAAELYDSIVALVPQHAPDAVKHPRDAANVPAAAAEALARVRPREAQRLAEQALNMGLSRFGRQVAERALSASWYGPTLSRGPHAACGVVRAYVVTDRVEQAQLVAHNCVRAGRAGQDVTTRRRLTEMWLTLAEAWAGKGRSTWAWQALQDAWQSEHSPDERARSAAHIARLLAMAGAARQLEKLLGGQPRHGVVAAAFVALAGHCAADDPDRAMGLLAEVERDQQYATDTSAAFDRHERLASLAGALVAVGRPDEAERLVEALGTPGARGWGYAVASAAVVDEDPRRARRLATQAAAETAEIDPRPRANMLVPVVRVLARIGAVDQAVKLGEQLVGQLRGDPSCAAYFCSVRAEIAAGLWQHTPDTAGRLVDMELGSGRPLGSRPLGLELAQFLVAVAPHDDQRGARIKELLSADFKKRPWSDERALLGLLTAAAEPAAARSLVDRAAVEHDKFQEIVSHHRTGTVLALAYASLGDHEAARAVAWRQSTEEARSETLAALAEYVACLPADLRLTQIRETPWADILIVRRLAGLLAPPSSGPDIPRARSLLAEALTPDGWHYAAPVLAAIDPDAVFRVRDVVFGYLGLTLSD